MLPNIGPSELLAAANVASAVIKQAGNVVESGLDTFAQILVSDPVAGASESEVVSAPADSSSAPLQDLSDQIVRLLSESGIQVNESLEVSVLEDGQVRVESDRQDAAQIESILTGDPQVRSKAIEYRKSGGSQQTRLEISGPDVLTEIGLQANMTRNRMTG